MPSSRARKRASSESTSYSWSARTLLFSTLSVIPPLALLQLALHTQRPTPRALYFSRIITSVTHNMSGKYIVVFKDHVSQSEIDKYAGEVNANGGEVVQRYDSVIKGFSASIPDQFLAQLQSVHNDTIDYIEPDTIVTTQ
ncbi:hypothetical protein BC628DRAFT_1393998 [Trametes gibbosa]|nr:hypothetical protein BC628DRAFT_1393998 [Trametes gibbosa]